MSERVLVGMSGGVDSSVAAALLKESGYDVVGAYMKNWTVDVPGSHCAWADDLAYAKRTAVRLDIDFRVYDFQDAYKRDVVDYMVAEYRAGRTPNPDTMCNQDVKFGMFLDTAEAEGFDFIATGHYAATEWNGVADKGLLNALVASGEADAPHAVQLIEGSTEPEPRGSNGAPHRHRHLLRAADAHKDQTYFLYRMTQRAVDRTLFPLGGLTKPQVRTMAEARNLPSADKPDSQGICFVGEAGIREFLRMYVNLQPGEIKDAVSGDVLGYHDGAIFFTIGQRKGLSIGGGKPHFVVGKDMDRNEVYVSDDPAVLKRGTRELRLERCSWVSGKPPMAGAYEVRTRHTGALCRAELHAEGEAATLTFAEDHERVAPGQSAVVYDGAICLGGGIVA